MPQILPWAGVFGILVKCLTKTGLNTPVHGRISTKTDQIPLSMEEYLHKTDQIPLSMEEYLHNVCFFMKME